MASFESPQPRLSIDAKIVDKGDHHLEIQTIIRDVTSGEETRPYLEIGTV